MKKLELLQQIAQNPTAFTADELYKYIKGVDIDERVTIGELCAAGLFFQIRNDIQQKIVADTRRQAIKKQTFQYAKEHADVDCIRQFFLQNPDDIADCEDDVWEVVNTVDSISAYRFYLEKYDNGKYFFIATTKIQQKEDEIRTEREELFRNMKENSNEYDYEHVKSILTPDKAIRDFEAAYPEDARDKKEQREYMFLCERYRKYKKLQVSIEDLVNYGVIPANDKIQKSMLRADSILQQRTIDEFSELREGRTDVFMIGLPRSGKSCVIGSLVARGYDRATLKYVPYMVEGQNGNRYDPYRQYYQDLVKAFAECNPPQSTVRDTLALMQVDVKSTKNGHFGREIIENHPLTLFEIGGEVFVDAADSMNNDGFQANLWKTFFAPKIVKSKNRKVLFFLVDYMLVANGAANQDMALYNILDVLQHDGDPDGKGNYTENCTMSKVDQCVILLTKCDLMGVEDRKTRSDIAWDYVEKKLCTFLVTLDNLSKKYHINNGKGARVMTFSLGRYYIGNSFEFDPTDADRLIEFLKNNTRKSK